MMWLFFVNFPGEILIWNDHNEELHEVPSLHDKPITVLKWSSNGTRLASGDKVIITLMSVFLVFITYLESWLCGMVIHWSLPTSSVLPDHHPFPIF